MVALKSSTISKKGQTTIPVEVRKLLKLQEGDSMTYEVLNDGNIQLKKAASFRDLEYLQAIEKTFANEWMGDEDDDL